MSNWAYKKERENVLNLYMDYVTKKSYMDKEYVFQVGENIYCAMRQFRTFGDNYRYMWQASLLKTRHDTLLGIPVQKVSGGEIDLVPVGDESVVNLLSKLENAISKRGGNNV